MEANLDRRAFLKGSLFAGAGLAAASMVSCAPSTDAKGGAAEGGAKGAETTEAPKEVAETLDTEILVLGAGASGLSCAIQAALNGSKATILEKASVTGGNASVCEGMFACGSDMQKAAGYTITEREVLAHELKFAQYCVDGQLWRDFVENSVENLNWCMDQGVEYRGDVDYYGGDFPTNHWFKGGKGAEGFTPQMTARAQELGVDIRLETPAYKLIVDDSGKVTGVYAKNADGKDIQVNAKATVIATGGWGCNEELIDKMGFDTTDWMQGGTDSHDGDGYKMALEAGAKDMMPQASLLAFNYCPALPRESFTHPYNGAGGITSGAGPVMWVNEEGKRFADESAFHSCMNYQVAPTRYQKAVYTVFDSKIWSDFTANVTDRDANAELAEAVETNSPESIWKADTIEELAKAAGIDPDALAASVKEYTADAESGEGDHVFGKDAQYMAPISTPPYYLARNRVCFMTNLAGVATSRKREVYGADGEPIPGLYAAGIDGEMRYRNVYPINCGGTTIAGFIYSGRVAANSAKDYIASLA